jgi:hypothetical protein
MLYNGYMKKCPGGVVSTPGRGPKGVALMVNTNGTTREAIQTAASGLFGGRTRQGECFFMRSHRDGECAKCIEMHNHDRELAAKASISLAVAA